MFRTGKGCVNVSRFLLKDYVYAIGGSLLSSVIAYNIRTGGSKTVSPMFGNRAYTSAAASEDEIIVVGGNDDSTQLDTAEVFNVLENK